MNSIEVFVACPVQSATTFSLWYRSVGSKRRRKFATINPFAVETNLEEVLVVPKFAASHDSVQLLRSPMGLCIRAIGRITWTDRREKFAVVMEKCCNLFASHRREEARRMLNVGSIGRHRVIQRMRRNIDGGRQRRRQSREHRDGEPVDRVG
jgi:hypothetical protein